MSQRPANAFLRALSTTSFAALLPDLSTVDLLRGDCLQRDGEPITWVYFPERSFVSEIVAHASGERLETSMTGNEGGLSLLEACGSQTASVDAVVQVDGTAVRMPAAIFQAGVLADPFLGSITWRLAELKLAESRQSAFCQAMHTVETRFARWMLEAMERSGGRNPLPITQEFLAAMLGVQRTTVSAHASALQDRGAISYSRGRIELLDLPQLERIACACRKATAQQRDRLGFKAIAVT